MKIDVKSAVAGLILGVTAMFCMGDALTSQNPRYQVAGNSTGVGGTYVIVDTQTGQAWGCDITKSWNVEANKQEAFWGAKNQ